MGQALREADGGFGVVEGRLRNRFGERLETRYGAFQLMGGMGHEFTADGLRANLLGDVLKDDENVAFKLRSLDPQSPPARVPDLDQILAGLWGVNDPASYVPH